MKSSELTETPKPADVRLNTGVCRTKRERERERETERERQSERARESMCWAAAK